MPTLQDVFKDYLKQTGKSVRAIAKEAGLGYQVVLGIVNRGSTPRKQQDREKLRDFLGIDEERWANMLLDQGSDGPFAAGDQETLQQLISREMYARGLTEQVLAKNAEVAYSTVMGITRKGTIPRNDSLDRIGSALGLDTEALRRCATVSRNLRRQPEAARIGSRQFKKQSMPLAQLVANQIERRRQSIGAFAGDIGVPYLVLSRFLESGSPPDDPGVLTIIRQALDLDEEHFTDAFEKSARQPKPASFSPKDALLQPDANALQRALVGYMRDNKMTLKALAKRVGLSQVTVSRLVKQGQAPTRATTHLKLQDLLGVDPERYQTLLSARDEYVPAPAPAADAKDEEDVDDGYHPHEITPPPFDHENPPSKDELIDLVQRLDSKQREELQKFLAALV